MANIKTSVIEKGPSEEKRQDELGREEKSHQRKPKHLHQDNNSH